jgi:hypothetical protein
MGNAYRLLGDTDRAKELLLRAVAILEPLGSPNIKIYREKLAALEKK